MATKNADQAETVENNASQKSADKPKASQATSGVDIKQLLEAGAHFGHKTSRWHPKMAQYIHSKKGGTHIIDLTKTADLLDEALRFVTRTAGEGKQILIVGTKRQAKDIVKKAGEDSGMPYVSERWLGGMMTNQNTIGGRVKYLKDQEAKMESGLIAAKYSKLEVQRFSEEIEEMNRIYGGIKNMAARVGAVFVTDVINEINAVREANKLGIPVIAIVDTNADPSLVKYPIPANDDAIKVIELITTNIVKAINGGKQKAKSAPTEKAEKGE